MNSWAQLIRLLPSTDTIVGKVLSVEGTTAILESLGTGMFVAQMGNVTYSVNDWVLVRDNVIVSILPVPELDPGTGGAKDISIF